MSSHYDILGLHAYRDTAIIPSDVLKTAYKRALLRFHPDKANLQSTSKSSPSNDRPLSVTVDDLLVAQRTLSDPRLKAEYDQSLRLHARTTNAANKAQTHRTGLDTIDLDAMTHDDHTETWSLPCRCGDTSGFHVSGHELEKYADDGEITIGCAGCSLWLRIVYTAED